MDHERAIVPNQWNFVAKSIEYKIQIYVLLLGNIKNWKILPLSLSSNRNCSIISVNVLCPLCLSYFSKVTIFTFLFMNVSFFTQLSFNVQNVKLGSEAHLHNPQKLKLIIIKLLSKMNRQLNKKAYKSTWTQRTVCKKW